MPLFRRWLSARRQLRSAASAIGTAVSAEPDRRRVVRDRVEKVESLPLDPYLKAVLAFALAAGAEALHTLIAEREGVPSAFEQLSSEVEDSADCYERALGVASCAYAARATEVTWTDQYHDVIPLVVVGLSSQTPHESRVLEFGPVGAKGGSPYPAGRHSPSDDRYVAFQRVVSRSLYESVLQAAPSEEALSSTLERWLIVWTEGWAAFGRLLGEYTTGRPPPPDGLRLHRPVDH